MMPKLIINVIDDEEKTKEKSITINCNSIDMVAVFDNGCYGWTRDYKTNDMFLKVQQNYANERLKTKGHLFLNEVHDMLGLPRTKIGQLVGWVYKDGKYVDFGLNGKLNERFNNGDSNTATLEFNVDGVILDKF